MIRFAVYPGIVVSPNDGDVHYIGFMTLCQLHGIDPREAINMGGDKARGVDVSRLLPLRVSEQGAGYWHVSELERNLYPLKNK